jgi:hypothetical protein
MKQITIEPSSHASEKCNKMQLLFYLIMTPVRFRDPSGGRKPEVCGSIRRSPIQCGWRAEEKKIQDDGVGSPPIVHNILRRTNHWLAPSPLSANNLLQYLSQSFRVESDIMINNCRKLFALSGDGASQWFVRRKILWTIEKEVNRRRCLEYFVLRLVRDIRTVWMISGSIGRPPVCDLRMDL